MSNGAMSVSLAGILQAARADRLDDKKARVNLYFETRPDSSGVD